eukprot:ctg_100.g109
MCRAARVRRAGVGRGGDGGRFWRHTAGCSEAARCALGVSASSPLADVQLGVASESDETAESDSRCRDAFNGSLAVAFPAEVSVLPSSTRSIKTPQHASESSGALTLRLSTLVFTSDARAPPPLEWGTSRLSDVGAADLTGIHSIRALVRRHYCPRCCFRRSRLRSRQGTPTSVVATAPTLFSWPAGSVRGSRGPRPRGASAGATDLGSGGCHARDDFPNVAECHTSDIFSNGTLNTTNFPGGAHLPVRRLFHGARHEGATKQANPPLLLCTPRGHSFACARSRNLFQAAQIGSQHRRHQHRPVALLIVLQNTDQQPRRGTGGGIQRMHMAHLPVLRITISDGQSTRLIVGAIAGAAYLSKGTPARHPRSMSYLRYAGLPRSSTGMSSTR